MIVLRTLGLLKGDRLPHSMLVTLLLSFELKVNWELYNKAWSISLSDWSVTLLPNIMQIKKLKRPLGGLNYFTQMFLLSSWSKFLLLNSIAIIEPFYISIFYLALFPERVHKYALIQIFIFHLSALPRHATGLFLYPLKTSENQRFSYVFRGYRNRSVEWNGLIKRRMDRHISCKKSQNLKWL